jgi:flagellar M-ring protein FliF
LLEQWKTIIGQLSPKQRVTIVIAAIALLGGLFGLTRYLQYRDYKPLFTGMAAEDASAVVAKLKEDGVEYRLGENGTSVLVPSARVDELRLSLAGAGIPKSGRIGFELFDKTNFGATDFTEHVNFRRALEGELERSIKTLSDVDQARVHVTFPKDSVFIESRQPAKASVILSLHRNANLTPANVTAVRYLISSAVEGLAPEAVSVMDTRGNLLSRASRALGDNSQLSEATIEYQQKVEKELLAKIDSTLEPLLGPGRFHAAVSADCDFTSGEEHDEEYDPDHSVMSTSQKTEDIAQNSAGAGGVPGTASALPNPAIRSASFGGGNSRKTESVSYNTSRTVKHIVYPQGGLSRLSISVLLDQDVRWEGTGSKARKIITPPSPEKVTIIRNLISAAVGFNTDRGDQLTVETLPFESTQNLEPLEAPAPAPASSFPQLDPKLVQNLMKQPKLLGIIAGAALLVLFVLFGLFRMLRGRGKRDVAYSAANAIAAPGLAEGSRALPPAPGAAAESTTVDSPQKQLEEHEAQRQQFLSEVQARLNLPPVTSGKIEALVGHLRENVKKDPALVANVLRTWLEESR